MSETGLSFWAGRPLSFPICKNLEFSDLSGRLPTGATNDSFTQTN